ncbi:uncharacterized protein LOC129224547 [Uloborus diversus]|uniref:uncharacterized protein LOC129224547 n=1 Tax=Uloborus diversus TaxID=327109 RepID=UPI00240A6CB8|nr:uncharacterized protein LOC129224547 [Uloborus diversus]
MRNTILTMLHLKDCTATTEVQELLTLILDTFLTDLCMSLKHYENEKDPLNAALPVAMGCIKGVKDLRDFYVTEVVERHAVIFRECFIRYRKFLKHRRFIKKNTTYWFKKVKKFPKVSLNPQRVSSRRATRRSDYSHQNKRTATFVKPLPRSELKQSSTVFESKDTTDDEKMECES